MVVFFWKKVNLNFELELEFLHGFFIIREILLFHPAEHQVREPDRRRLPRR